MAKFKKVSVVFFGVYLFTVLSAVQAQNAPQANGPLQKWHPGQRVQEIYSQLNLTDDQKKQLEVNKQQHRAIMQSARQEMKTSREALQRELMKAQLDLPRINAIHDKIKSLQSRMEDVKLSSILAVRAILTPEQFLKFVNLMHKHKQGHDDQPSGG